MKILLVTPMDPEFHEDHVMDALLLMLRGYEVVTLDDRMSSLFTPRKAWSPKDRVRALALEMIDGEKTVLHPKLSAWERIQYVGLGNTLGHVSVDMERLPCAPPEHYEEWASANRALLDDGAVAGPRTDTGTVPATTTTRAERMRERPIGLIQHVRHWVQCFDAYLGDSRKNPMSREVLRQRKAELREYRCDLPTTTTG